MGKAIKMNPTKKQYQEEAVQQRIKARGTWMIMGVLGLMVIMIVASCGKSASGRLGKGTTTFVSDEGWVNENTYRMVVYGQWDRSAYYEEGGEVPDDTIGKVPKSSFGLREDAKVAAKVKAIRNFKEKMVVYVESETQVSNSTLIADVVNSSLRGVAIAPQAVKEEYSRRHDASVTYIFEAEGLKKVVDEAVQQTLERFEEGSEDAGSS